MVASFLLGMLIWTLIEYIIHRWIFHMETSTGGWNWFHFFAHGIHHLCPTDASRLTFPPVFSVVLGTAFYKTVVGGLGPGYPEVQVHSLRAFFCSEAVLLLNSAPADIFEFCRFLLAAS
jgi:hypothetical protein